MDYGTTSYSSQLHLLHSRVCDRAKYTTLRKMPKTVSTSVSFWNTWGAALTENSKDLPTSSTVVDPTGRESVVRRSLRRVKNLLSPGNKPTPKAEIPPPDEDYQHLVFVSRFTDRAVFNKLRLYLAYFYDNPDVCMRNGDSAVSILSFLVCSGLPPDVTILREVYRSYLTYRSISENAITADLSTVCKVMQDTYIREAREYSVEMEAITYNMDCVPECCLLLPFCGDGCVIM